jgi:uncharacterized damage-inducible protein DinB
MDRWGAALYGEPCRECGFTWTLPEDAAVAIIAELPRAYAQLLSGASGTEQLPELGWSVCAYVCHVADNFRIWAERLAGALAGSAAIGAYDQDLLATARGYEQIPLAAAQWSLDRSVAEWLDVVVRSDAASTRLVHPERGEMTLLDVALANAHDAVHHQWDIERTLRTTSG